MTRLPESIAIVFVWLVLIFCPCKGTTANGQEETEVEKLHNHLFDNYNKHVQPTKALNKTVHFGIALINLNLIEKESIMVTDLWLRFVWKDPKFEWNEDDFGGTSVLRVPKDLIWKPDIMLYNNAHTTSEKTLLGDTHALIYPDGEVLWVPPVTFKSYCLINLRHWPMDTQTCRMTFGSWTHDGFAIRLNLYNNQTEVDLEEMGVNGSNLGEWNVDSTSVVLNNKTYSCCPEPYLSTDFTFNIHRRSNAYKTSIVAPCIILMLTTICSFLLTPGSGEKLGLNGVAMIGSILFLIYISSALPFHQNNVPLIVIFFANTLILSGMAVLINALCIRMVRIRKLSSPPMIINNALGGIIGTVLCLGSSQVSNTSHSTSVSLSEIEGNRKIENAGGRQISPIHEKLSVIQDEWNMVAVAVERICLILYILSFFIIILAYA